MMYVKPNQGLALTVENVVLNEQGLNLSQVQVPAFPCTAGSLPRHSLVCLGPSLCLQLCFSTCISLVPVILSFGHPIQEHAKCGASPLSVSLAYVESVRLEPAKVRSVPLYAEFPCCERPSTPLPLSFASPVHLESPYSFPGTYPIFFWLASASLQVLLLFVCSSLDF